MIDPKRPEGSDPEAIWFKWAHDEIKRLRPMKVSGVRMANASTRGQYIILPTPKEQKKFNFAINQPNDPVRYYPYSQQLEVSGQEAEDFTFEILDGALPDGLSMTDSGLITGTPTEVFDPSLLDPDPGFPNRKPFQLTLRVRNSAHPEQHSNAGVTLYYAMAVKISGSLVFPAGYLPASGGEVLVDGITDILIVDHNVLPSLPDPPDLFSGFSNILFGFQTEGGTKSGIVIWPMTPGHWQCFASIAIDTTYFQNTLGNGLVADVRSAPWYGFPPNPNNGSYQSDIHTSGPLGTYDLVLSVDTTNLVGGSHSVHFDGTGSFTFL